MVSCSQLNTLTTGLLSIIQAATTASFFLLECTCALRINYKKNDIHGDRDQNQRKTTFKEVLLNAMGRSHSKTHLNTETLI